MLPAKHLVWRKCNGPLFFRESHPGGLGRPSGQRDHSIKQTEPLGTCDLSGGCWNHLPWTCAFQQRRALLQKLLLQRSVKGKQVVLWQASCSPF